MKKKNIFIVFAGPIVCFLFALIAYLLPTYAGDYISLNYYHYFFLAGKTLVYVGIVWFIFKVVDVFVDHISQKTSLTGRMLDASLASFIGGTLKIIALLIAGIPVIMESIEPNTRLSSNRW